MALERHTDPQARERGLAALDATFTELTGVGPVRNPDRAYGARGLSYLDCMRDLDVTIGPGLIARMAPALHVLFEAGRWFCGEVNAIGTRIVEDAVPPGDGAPFIEIVKRALPAVATARKRTSPSLASDACWDRTREPPGVAHWVLQPHVQEPADSKTCFHRAAYSPTLRTLEPASRGTRAARAGGLGGRRLHSDEQSHLEPLPVTVNVGEPGIAEVPELGLDVE